ncbi:MAG: ATP-binding domain-containing protein, partial [Vallitaleaceae bacterium]|nr:ATP-binding domain-containing protein [Vallitaleaceae bacterium]
IEEVARASKKLIEFYDMIMHCKSQQNQGSLVQLLQTVLTTTGYKEELRLEGTDEAKDRINNIDELVSKLTDYEKGAEEPTLNGFLEEVSLVADIDQLEENKNVVILMTLHSAKGLEFPYVFLAGLEDGLFPSYMSITSGEDDIEEERRLCYVGITRAEQELTITCAGSRMMHGLTQTNPTSRFIKEIPKDLLNREEVTYGAGTYQVNDYRERQSLFKSQPYAMNQIPKAPLPISEKATLNYKEGDLVMHKQFGMGQVSKIEPGGKDYQVTVNFPSVGIKKLFASLAGLKKT